jgi:hypothetical protein
MKTKTLNRATPAFLALMALPLAGCWTPPNANVQPHGSAGLIQSGVMVASTKNPANVQAVDTGQRTITLTLPSGDARTYKVGAKVKHFDGVQVGDKVKATVTEELAIYVLENGRLPDGGTAETLGVNAKVLLVDPSYRLLTLQFPNGHSETLKPGLHTKMLAMSPGDSVAVRPVEVTALRVEK